MKNPKKTIFPAICLIFLTSLFLPDFSFCAQIQNRIPLISFNRMHYYAFVNEELLVDLKATDKDGDSLTYTMESCYPYDFPEGASINSEGLFYWAPRPEQAGKRYAFKYAADDGVSKDHNGNPIARYDIYIDVIARNSVQVDLAYLFPPAGNQGQVNSCTFWATAYHYKTAQERQEHGPSWDVKKKEYQFSPYFMICQFDVNDGVGGGEGFAVLTRQGCATLAVHKSTDGLPTIEQYEAALQYRDKIDPSILKQDDTKSQLDYYRGFLDKGKPFVFNVTVYSSLFGYKGGVYNNTAGSIMGDHALVVVGYDDNLEYKEAGQKYSGAFKVINSWGTGWGRGGYGWLSYSFVLNHGSGAEYVMSRTSYQPNAILYFSLAPYKKPVLKGNGDLWVSFNVSGQNFDQIRSGTTLEGFLDKNRTAAAMDLTDFLSYLPPSPENKWYATIRDRTAVTGERLDIFKIKYRASDNEPFREYSATNLPIDMSFPGETIQAYISGQNVSNQLPTAPTVMITPELPTFKDTLVATITSPSLDSDADQITYKYNWYCGQKVGKKIYWNPSGNGMQLSGFHANEIVKCVVIPHDGKADGPGGEAQVIIQKTPPKLKPVEAFVTTGLEQEHHIDNNSASLRETEEIRITVKTEDQDNNYVFSVSGLPRGAKFDKKTYVPRYCYFTWTPDYTQAGSYPLTFTVKDGKLSDSHTFTIIVAERNRAPVLKVIPQKTVKAGRLLKFILSATDPDKDKLTYKAASMPPGATLDRKTGVFTWTPDASQVGAYTITFKASDGKEESSKALSNALETSISANITVQK